MALPFVVSVAAGVAAGLVGLFSLALSRAPGARALRPFAALSFAAAGVCVCFALPLHAATAAATRPAIAVAFAFVAAHGAAWWWLVAALDGRSLRAGERVVLALHAAWGLASLVPGLLLQSTTQTHVVEWLDTVYLDVPPTTLGRVVSGAFFALLGVPLVRLARRVRRGSRAALLHGLALALVGGCGVNDGLVQLGAYEGPYLLPVGLAAVLVATGATLAERVVVAAVRLAALNAELARLAAARTEELVRADALDERGRATAAIGQLAAGAAHELNNAAAVASAGLGYLAEQLAAGEIPPDLDDVRGELGGALARMQAVSERLQQAGRFVQAPRGPSRPLALRAAVQAVLDARPPRPSLRHRIEIPAELCAPIDPLLLAPLLDELAANAEAALGAAGGELRIRAAVRAGALELEVADDGPGVPLERQEALFEPFGAFRTAPGHVGLGLPAAAGLARAMGGTLALCAVPRGACFRLQIPLADASPGRVAA